MELIDYSKYDLTTITDNGRVKVYTPKKGTLTQEQRDLIRQHRSEVYYKVFDNLPPMTKFKIFENSGCEALIDGEWVEVGRDYYIKALGLEGLVE